MKEVTMKMRFLSILLLVILMKRVRVTVISSNEKRQDHSLVECHTLVGCGPCLSHTGCVFCRDTDFTEESRCGTREYFLTNSTCNSIEDPPNSVDYSSIVNQSLTSSSAEEFIQISPQYMKLKLRVGQEEEVKFSVAQALEYPVDLYYLMDLSNSMSDDRDNIVKLGGELATAIEKITRDYRIGFGSFVDKEVMPYISLVKDDNCQQENVDCPAPYSFQHQMSLRQNATEFAERVRAAPISGNIDNPEGGFDALMQVIVCGDLIGWREDARRVIIYTTDQSFHIAGDGKLGGLVAPNDGQCHLNSTGFYDWSTLQDYPSLGHINHVAKEHSVNVIWAVTSSHLSLYQGLTQLMTASVAGEISSDSSNVVELIQELYGKITTTIRVEDNSSESVSIHYMSDCNKKQSRRRTKCRNIPIGTPVEFTAHITLKECSKENQVIRISPVGMDDQFVVEVEPICDCECNIEGSEGYEYTSEHCNYQGNSICGECHCFDRPEQGDKFFGTNCECSGNHTNPLNPESTCRAPDAGPSSQLCSGRGACECGECVCDKSNSTNIYGQFCECDDNSCDRSLSGLVCGGHGQCECGQCECDAGWTGPACDCRDDVTQCLSPDGQICSGHGECVCGQCKRCEDGYSGQFCSVCMTCPDKCQSLKACVECLAFRSGDLMETFNEKKHEHPDFCLENCDLLFKYKEKLSSRIPGDWVNCTLKNDSYCEYTFSYQLETWSKDGPEKVFLHLNEEKEKGICPVIVQPDFFGIIIGIAGGIVAVGMLTILLWKVFTTITDRREFAKFEYERQEMKFNSNSNPIFKQATTTIQNPIYCKEAF